MYGIKKSTTKESWKVKWKERMSKSWRPEILSRYCFVKVCHCESEVRHNRLLHNSGNALWAHKIERSSQSKVLFLSHSLLLNFKFDKTCDVYTRIYYYRRFRIFLCFLAVISDEKPLFLAKRDSHAFLYVAVRTSILMYFRSIFRKAHKERKCSVSVSPSLVLFWYRLQ